MTCAAAILGNVVSTSGSKECRMVYVWSKGTLKGSQSRQKRFQECWEPAAGGGLRADAVCLSPALLFGAHLGLLTNKQMERWPSPVDYSCSSPTKKEETRQVQFLTYASTKIPDAQLMSKKCSWPRYISNTYNRLECRKQIQKNYCRLRRTVPILSHPSTWTTLNL